MGHVRVGQREVPAWIVRAVVGAVISVLVAGAAAWGASQSARGHDHETRIAVIENHQKETQQDVKDVLKALRNQGGRE